MKVAISSASFARTLAAGELTQLEWLESCASRLAADGVVFERRHFPRVDREYAAQLRKIAVDLGLVPLAVDDPELLAPERPEADGLTTIELAGDLGALFVLTLLPAPGDVPPATFVAAVGAAKAVVKAAKARNVTLLVRPAGGTLAADAAGLRHFRTNVDSAWLGFALPAGADRSALTGRDRAPIVTVGAEADLDAVAELDEAARPWLLLSGEASGERVSALRFAAAKKTLARASAPW
jgi:hypothetical protein